MTISIDTMDLQYWAALSVPSLSTLYIDLIKSLPGKCPDRSICDLGGRNGGVTHILPVRRHHGLELGWMKYPRESYLVN